MALSLTSRGNISVLKFVWGPAVELMKTLRCCGMVPEASRNVLPHLCVVVGGSTDRLIPVPCQAARTRINNRIASSLLYLGRSSEVCQRLRSRDLS